MDIKQQVTIYKSLADETRLDVVHKLAQVGREVDGSEIIIDCSLALKLSQPTMSHHFAKLVAAGVISERKEGTKKYYELNHKVLAQAGFNVRKLKR